MRHGDVSAGPNQVGISGISGPATMLRSPASESAAGLDAAFLGVPFDLGTAYRPGARFGPRSIREQSAALNPVNLSTGAAPFNSLAVADLGDIGLNPYNLVSCVQMIEERVAEVVAHGCRPLMLGGDHTVLLPHLRAVSGKGSRPLGLVHIDAHSDTGDESFGEKITYGTMLRRAVEEGLIDPGRVVQIGLRGTGHSADQFAWGERQGFHVVRVEELWNKSASPTMGFVRSRMGAGPVYVSFDVDALDPSVAPGTGTWEPGGLTSVQALEIVRGLRGLDVVGCDLVEVCPAYDHAGMTGLVGARLLFELLCILPGVRYD